MQFLNIDLKILQNLKFFNVGGGGRGRVESKRSGDQDYENVILTLA